MVGSDAGAKDFRKMFVILSSSTFTSIEFWLKEPLESLKYWFEALANEGGEQ